MTSARDLGLTLFSDIDQALVKGVASYQVLIDLRKEIRGGDPSPGLDLFSGRVPHIIAGSNPVIYDVQDGDTPIHFISRTEIETTETNSARYTPTMVSILPSWMLNQKLADSYLQRYADALLQAVMRGKNLQCNTVSDYLEKSADGAGAAIRYRIVALAIEGGEEQPRLLTRVEFLVPASVLENTPQGIMEG